MKGDQSLQCQHLLRLPPSSSLHYSSILRHCTAAQTEEQCGCFGLAELQWKAALKLCENRCPGTETHAIVAASLGLFMQRFLPQSAIPLKHFETAVRLYHHLGKDCERTTILHLTMCLIDCGRCSDAEKVLESAHFDKSECEVWTKCCGGMAAKRVGNVSRAQQILQECVAQLKVLYPGSHVYAEISTFLASVLLEKEEFTTCETLILEVLPPLVQANSEYLLPCIRVLFRCYRETHRYKEIENMTESIVEELEKMSSPPYYIAKVLTASGDSYITISPTTAIFRYLQSLSLYQSVRESSWYVAVILQRIAAVIRDEETADFDPWVRTIVDTANTRLEEMVKRLPTVATMLHMNAPDLHTFFQYFIDTKGGKVCEKVGLLVGSEDEAESAEALMAVISADNYDQEVMQELSEKHLSAHPSSRYSAALFLPGDFDDSEFPPENLEKPIETDSVTYEMVDKLQRLRAKYRIAGDDAKGLSAELRELEVLKAINPRSNKCVNTLLSIGVKTASKELMQEAINIAIERASSSIPAQISLPSGGFELCNDERYRPLLSSECNLFIKTAEYRLLEKLQCSKELDFAFVEKVVCDTREYAYAEYALKAVIWSGITIREFRYLELLRLGVNWFYGENVEIDVRLRGKVEVYLEGYYEDLSDFGRAERVSIAALQWDSSNAGTYRQNRFAAIRRQY